MCVPAAPGTSLSLVQISWAPFDIYKATDEWAVGLPKDAEDSDSDDEAASRRQPKEVKRASMKRKHTYSSSRSRSPSPDQSKAKQHSPRRSRPNRRADESKYDNPSKKISPPPIQGVKFI